MQVLRSTLKNKMAHSVGLPTLDQEKHRLTWSTFLWLARPYLIHVRVLIKSISAEEFVAVSRFTDFHHAFPECCGVAPAHSCSAFAEAEQHPLWDRVGHHMT